MKTTEITAGKVYGDGLGRKRRVLTVIRDGCVTYEKVFKNADNEWQKFDMGICKLQSFASWAKEELE